MVTTEAELAAQPMGYWTGAAYRTIVGRIRSALAEEQLNQPYWWILNHVAGAPGGWDRQRLTARLIVYDDQDTDFAAVLDGLERRGWLARAADGSLTLSEEGERGRLRARERTMRVHAQMQEGITPQEYAATITVLRRMIANLGGDADLPR